MLYFQHSQLFFYLNVERIELGYTYLMLLQCVDATKAPQEVVGT